MPAAFVHGVPDTHRLWDPLCASLHREDVVARSLPGFGAPLPNGFDPTAETYVGWLTAQLERLDPPVDLVGHDWGAILAQLVAAARPDLVRTLACGGAAVDAQYRWHRVARAWRTPLVGEALMALATPARIESRMTRYGVPAAAAREQARHVDATMKRCILRLYRSASSARAAIATPPSTASTDPRWSSGASRIRSSNRASRDASRSAYAASWCCSPTAATGGRSSGPPNRPPRSNGSGRSASNRSSFAEWQRVRRARPRTGAARTFGQRIAPS